MQKAKQRGSPLVGARVRITSPALMIKTEQSGKTMARLFTQQHTAIIAIKLADGKDIETVVDAEVRKLTRHAGLRHPPVRIEGNYAVLSAGRTYWIEISATYVVKHNEKKVRITVNGTGIGTTPQRVQNALQKTGYEICNNQQVPLDALHMIG